MYNPYLVFHGPVVTQICQILQILLDNLRDVLNPLGRRLRRVGERLSPTVHLRQRSLKGRGRARCFTVASVVLALRRKFGQFRRRVGRHVGGRDGRGVAAAQGGGGEQGGVVVLVVVKVMQVTAAAHGYRRGLGIGRYGGAAAATVADKAASVGQLLMVAVVVCVCRRGRETACHVE